MSLYVKPCVWNFNASNLVYEYLKNVSNISMLFMIYAFVENKLEKGLHVCNTVFHFEFK